MSLIEEIKASGDQAFDAWFERWYRSKDFPKTFKQSAQQGFTGYTIKLSKLLKNDDDQDYLNRRLRDPRTIEKLKENLTGIEVEYVKNERKNLLNQIFVDEYITFRWEDNE